MWNIGNSTEDHRGREGNLKGEKNHEDYGSQEKNRVSRGRG